MTTPEAPEAPAAVGTHFVSIVMPCLNEAQTVASCVTKALRWLESSGYAGEVVVVDNGSTDGSDALAVAAGARVVYEARRGYGAALRRGFAEARGDWLVMGDADDTYDFGDLGGLIEPLAKGHDICIGNRFTGGIAAGAMTWSHRYLGTPAITALIRLFCGLRVGDSQCGLRAFGRSSIEALDLRTDGMELASEMILKAARQGLRVTETPVPYAERLGEAKLNTLRDGWRHLRFLLLATPNYLFTLPGLMLTVIGMLTFALALPSDRIEIGGRAWQPIFAGGIFVVVGMNALLLGFATRLYTSARGITNDGWVVRFYHRYLSLELLLLAGVAIVALGLAIDGLLVFVDTGDSRLVWAAIAQALIIVGANLALVGALASILDERK